MSEIKSGIIYRKSPPLKTHMYYSLRYLRYLRDFSQILFFLRLFEGHEVLQTDPVSRCHSSPLSVETLVL